ncbi:tetratricopeptide repeat protein [Zestomonas carbonaria]|uniref:Tetratrico peptide repeat group 5 domain-containing protein n=1 Tax=Zestomonas carbonaria TaxID=2762745 RepID=A0A7U7I9H0_9GAMM|nr:tetratricopeptide repeat protein [Pseudomonas carbonaria]CAD5108384.1 hypothetical protein PSEWESI4_02669 [Pseudomonas carbonaria]
MSQGEGDQPDAHAYLREALRLDRASREGEAIGHYRKALALGLSMEEQVLATICLGSSLRNVGEAEESHRLLAPLAASNNAAFLFQALALYDCREYRRASGLLMERLLALLVERDDPDVRPFARPLARYVERVLDDARGDVNL